MLSMTDTLDAERDLLVAEPEAAADEGLEVNAPATSGPSRAERRAAARMGRTARKAARRAARAETEQPNAAVIEVVIDESDPLLGFLQAAPGPLDLVALPQFSPAVQRMREQGVQTVVPLVTSGELVGVVALGPRRSERTYSRTDKRLLDSLARYAAPALRLGQLMREQ